MAVHGPSKAEITCVDNGDGTCTVEYVPDEPGKLWLSSVIISSFKFCSGIVHRVRCYKEIINWNLKAMISEVSRSREKNIWKKKTIGTKFNKFWTPDRRWNS